MIEFASLKRNYEMHAAEYKEAVNRVLESGNYILGDELTAFEEEFASYLNGAFCVGVNSGTDALILAIRALGIGAGDEVIIPGSTYIASALGVTENGATPVYVDVNDDFLIDEKKIIEKINKKTKAILVVHLYGQICNMDEIMKISKEYDIPVIEDCAQCHGALYKNKHAGTFGKIACFSFYPTKPLGAFGDAGAIVTCDRGLAEKLRMMRNYGSKIKYRNEIIGINSRLDELQAALLRVSLKYLDENNNKRIGIANEYIGSINNDNVKMPLVKQECVHVFHLFPVIVDNQEKFCKYMEAVGVNVQIHYPIPPFMAECYREHSVDLLDLKKSIFLSKHEVSLPIYAGMPDEDVDYVIKAVNEYK